MAGRKKQKKQDISKYNDSDSSHGSFSDSSFMMDNEEKPGRKRVLFPDDIKDDSDEFEGLDSFSNSSISGSDDLDEKDAVDDMKDEGENEIDLDQLVHDVLEEENIDIPNVNIARDRIGKIIEVLSSGKNSSISYERSKLVKCLIRYLAFYYGYSEYMIEKLYHLFPLKEYLEFLEANQVPRPVTIRVNTLKIKKRNLIQALKDRGMTVECIDKISDACLQVFESNVPVGATPEYLAGHYMLQSAASILPVLALKAKPNERILDMCAAPGGKTTHIAAMMKNTGFILAVDVNKERSKALLANLHRLGVSNAIVTCQDSKKIPTKMRGFNRVLLDAPCSGTGVISKDASVKVSKSDDDFSLLSHLQRELLVAAVESTVGSSNPDDGIIVYSTCSIMVEENEQVIDYILRKYSNIRLVDTEIEFGNSGFTNFRGKAFHPSLKLTKRFYPHVNNVDGFFVAKLKKAPENIRKKRGQSNKK